MRPVVPVVFALVLVGCGGGGTVRTIPPAGGNSSSSAGAPNTAVSALRRAVGLSASTLQFNGTGWSAMRVLTTTWGDDSRKSAVSSDETVVTVSPPYQRATWVSPGVFSAKYYVTPVGPGTATIRFSDHDGSEYADLAVTVVAPPTGTLYVASAGEVDAFPAGANGTTAPQRRITGFFKQRMRPENVGFAARAITVGPDRKLYVVKNIAYPRSNDCSVIAESPTANGTSGALGSVSCAPTGAGVAVTPGGEIDALTRPALNASTVLRYVNGRPTSTLSVRGDPTAIATDANGNLYVSAFIDTTTVAGRIYQFPPGAADGSTPVRTIAIPEGSYFGSISVATNGDLYAVSIVPNYELGTSTQSISVYPPGATTPSRTLGPFTRVDIPSITVSKGGELYVAVNQTGRYSGSQSRVDVYAPNASGNAAPVRTIPSPIPGDAVGGTLIVAIALSPSDPAPPEEVLNRRRAP